jgi:hypothetical protein
VLWLKIGCMRPTCQAGGACLVTPLPFPHWILLLPTSLTRGENGFWKYARTWPVSQGCGVGWDRALCHIVSLCHIVCEHPWFWT